MNSPEQTSESMLSLPPVQWLANPQLGLIAVMMGFLAAWLLIPIECSLAGELRLPGLVFATGLLAPMLLSALLAPKSVFHALNIVIAAPLFWLLLDLIQGSYPLPGIDRDDVTNSFLCIALFAGGVCVGGMLPAWQLSRVLGAAVRYEISDRQLMSLIIIAFVLAFLRFAIPSNFDLFVMANALTGSRWAVPWGRGLLGGWDAFLDHFQYFGYILPILTVLLARRVGWLNSRTIAALILTAIIVLLLATGGGRRIIGVLAGSGFVVWFLASPKAGLKHLLGFGVFVATLLLFMQIMLLYRRDGLSNVFSGDLEERLASKQNFHVDDNFLRLTQLTTIIPEQHPHTTWRWLLWVAVRPIPRVLWPGKPIDAGFDLPSTLGMRGVSLSTSVIGELYMAFGFIGCALGGLFWGRLAQGLATLLEEIHTVGALTVYGIGTLALFSGVRSAIELVLMSYGIVGWILVLSFYRHFVEGGEPNLDHQ